jgi:DNA recombination protein RmuC
LGSSVDSFNEAVGSLEQQVLPAARRFPELGLRVQRDLEVPEPVDALTRTAARSRPTSDGRDAL